MYQVGEGAFQIKHGCALLHHINNYFTTGGLFFRREREFCGVRIGRVEVEGDGTDILCVARCDTDVLNRVLVYLINRHIEADVIRGRVADVLHDGVVGVAADDVVVLAVTVKTQKYQVCFRQINGKGTVGNDVNNQKSHCLGFDYEVAQGTIAILPKKRFTAAEEQDAYTHVVELLHFTTNLFIGVNDSGDVVDGAVFAMQVALVRNDDRTEDGVFFSE